MNTIVFPNIMVRKLLNWKILVLLLCLAIIVFREPELFTAPQFWAEEGTQYFNLSYYYAHSPEWYKGLVQIQMGYFSLWPNLATTIAANLLPIEYAPFATTFFAFSVHVIIIASILWLDSNLWKNAYIKTLCIVMLILVPNTWEVWLNTINSQFLFSVVTFILLNAEMDKYKVRRYLSYVTLFFCGLTGIVSDILTPIFIFKAIRERKKYQIVQAIILCFCTVLQGIIIFKGLINNQASLTNRWDLPDISTIASIIMTQNIGYLIGGLDNMSLLFSFLDSLRLSNGYVYVIISAIFILLEVLFLFLLTFYLKIDDKINCIGAYFLVLGISILGSLAEDKFYLSNPYWYIRYFYAPNAIIILTLLANIQANYSSINKLRDKILFILLVGITFLSLYWGISQFKSNTPYNTDWPKWENQIQIWREDPSRPIEIWPMGWKFELNKVNSD